MDSPQPPLALLRRLLELEFGESRLLHYGLFDEAGGDVDSDDLLAAQHRFSRKLSELCLERDSTARMLLVGDSLTAVLKDLVEAQRSVAWVGNEELLTAELMAQKNFEYLGEDFVGCASAVGFDLLLHEGSIRYLDQMAILSKCREALSSQGSLLFFGEFLQDDSAIEYSALPNLFSFKNLSARLGFALSRKQDLTADGVATLKLVKPLLLKHGATLIEEGVTDKQGLSALENEFFTMQEEFSSGRRVLSLFELGREQDHDGEWVNAQYGDIQSFSPTEVVELFQESFGVEFNEHLWKWKYEGGNGTCVVARLEKNSEIVAHYGGAPRNISYFGDLAVAIQPCDVMVHPSMRKKYGRGSLFFEVAATFLEREIGNTVNHLLGFGFPNQKTMNISKRLGLYEKTDDFVEIVYPSLRDKQESLSFELSDFYAEDEAANSDLDRLWSSMRPDYAKGIIGVRDADYIRYRYIDHPFSKAGLYRCVFIRCKNTGDALAFAVLKVHESDTLLMDIVCPTASMKEAIAYLNQYLSEEKPNSNLRLWITKSGTAQVLSEGAIVNDLGIEIPCNSWNPGPSSQLLYGAWWLTAGDMDFV